MNRFWQQAFDQTTRLFQPSCEAWLASRQSKRGQGRFEFALRIGRIRNPAFIENIFNDIISVGFVPSHPGLLRQIKADTTRRRWYRCNCQG